MTAPHALAPRGRATRALLGDALLGVSLLGLALAATALPPTPRAYAHRGSVKHLVVEPLDTGANVRVEVETVDVAVELGLGERADEAETLRDPARIREWLRAGIHVENDDGRCEMRALDQPIERLDDGDTPRIAVALVASCSEARPLTLVDETIFENDAQHEAYVRLRFSDGDETSVLRRGRQRTQIGAPSSVGSLLLTFLEEGILHLVTGYDHLLFLLSLLLTSGLRAKKDGLRRELRDVTFVVTAFTVGHSVTLIAAALGWLVLPARLVESAIALSIVIVALLNITKPDTRAPMPWIALGFGLVHGFGFSGVLAELGLPARARVLSLLSFNVGIELAQIAAVLLAIGPLTWLAKHARYRDVVVRGGSALIAIIATYWMIGRALGYDVG